MSVHLCFTYKETEALKNRAPDHQPVSERAGICYFTWEASDGLCLQAQDFLLETGEAGGTHDSVSPCWSLLPGLNSVRVIRESWFVTLGRRARGKEGVGRRGLQREEPRERTCPALAPALWPSPWLRPRPRHDGHAHPRPGPSLPTLWSEPRIVGDAHCRKGGAPNTKEKSATHTFAFCSWFWRNSGKWLTPTSELGQWRRKRSLRGLRMSLEAAVSPGNLDTSGAGYCTFYKLGMGIQPVSF